jgi:hypothetical protein
LLTRWPWARVESQALGDSFVEYGDPAFMLCFQACDQFLHKDVVDCLGVPMREFVSPMVDAGQQLRH